MNLFASTRSEKRARQPLPGLAQWRVGSIDEDGIRYGFTTQALIASTIATAPMIVTAQSIASRAASLPSGGRSDFWSIAAAEARRRRGCRSLSGSRRSRRAARGPRARRRRAGPAPRGAPTGTCARSRRGPRSGRDRARAGGRPPRSPPARHRGRRRARRRDPSPEAPRAALLSSPLVDPSVVSRQEDLRDLPAPELRRPCVLRIFEPAAECRGEAFLAA